MPTASIKTNIKLDGEKEYKAAVGEINTALGTLDSKLKLLKNTYAENKDNVEGLTKINETLNEKILTQKEKISALEDALKNAAQEYGESDARTQKWQQQLNKANSTLIDMERELRDNTDALKDAGVEADNFSDGMEDLVEKTGAVDEQSASFGTTLQDVADKLGIQLPAGAQEAVNGLGGVNVAAGAAVFGLAALVTAIVKVEKALIDVTKESAKFADDILTMSMTTGQSAEQLQEFSYAAELIDVSIDTLQTSLTKLTNNMQNAMNGTGDAKKAFEQLGIAVTDSEGNMRTANDVFYETIDALGKVGNATERDALSMDIFGRSAQDLNPLIIQGSDTLREYADEAHNVGYVLDNEALSALGAVDDGFQRLQTTQDAVKNNMAAEFAPYLTSALEDIRALIEKVGKALIDSGAVEAFGSILESSVSLLEPLGALVTTILPALSLALKPIVEAVALLADTMDVLVGMLTLNGDKISTALGWNASRGQLSHQQVASGAYSGYRYSESAGWIESGVHTEAELRAEYAKNPVGTYEYWKQLHGYNAAGTDYWYGGRTLIGENGPEMAILPQGTRILTAQESRQAGGGDTYNITIPASSIKEFEDIIRIVKNRRRVSRMGGES
nr:MAG TPA: tail tape measure [Caudoviricetes sp.]